jgi:hypothetical protein
MDIPDALKSLTQEKHEFISVLLQDQSKGIIVARVAFLDFLLGEMIAEYFCSASRQPEFLESIVGRLSFDAKIRTLEEMALEGQLASLRDQIIVAIRPMQKLRNVAAHAAALKTPEVDKLYSDKVKRDLLVGFPKAFEEACSDIQGRLQHLKQQAGFAVTN